MQKDLAISAAKHADIPALCELLAILFEQEPEFEIDAARQTAGLKQILDKPEQGHIVVLRDGDRPVGMVVLLFTLSTAMGGRVAVMEDMVLRPEYRNRGAGSELIREAIEFARQSGCKRITLLTDRANVGAHDFYMRNGFRTSTMKAMRLILDGSWPKRSSA